MGQARQNYGPAMSKIRFVLDIWWVYHHRRLHAQAVINVMFMVGGS
jgi:hypothetical protein